MLRDASPRAARASGYAQGFGETGQAIHSDEDPATAFSLRCYPARNVNVQLVALPQASAAAPSAAGAGTPVNSGAHAASGDASSATVAAAQVDAAASADFAVPRAPAGIAARLCHSGEAASGTSLILFADGVTSGRAYFEASARPPPPTAKDSFAIGLVDADGARCILESSLSGTAHEKGVKVRELKNALYISSKADSGVFTGNSGPTPCPEVAAPKESVGLLVDFDCNVVEKYVDGRPTGARHPCFLQPPLFLTAALAKAGDVMTVARRPPPVLKPLAAADDSEVASAASPASGFVSCDDPDGTESGLIVVCNDRGGASPLLPPATRIRLTQRGGAPTSRFRSSALVQPSAPFLQIELPAMSHSKLQLRVGVTPSANDTTLAAATSDDGLLFTFDIGYLEMTGTLGVVLHDRTLYLFNREAVRRRIQTGGVDNTH